MFSALKRWRVQIAALLLLALPLQGLAAACMLGCVLGSPVMAGSAASTDSTQVAMAMDHAGHHAGHHAQAQHAAVALDQGSPANDNSDARHSDHGAGSEGGQKAGQHQHHTTGAEAPSVNGDGGCSACAACCVGAAMPAGEEMFSAQGQPQAVDAGATPGLSHSSPDGLERPPRTGHA